MADRRIKLTGGPEKTVTWIWLEAGRLKIEFYDFSETAQRMFGNDIAYTITVSEITSLLPLTKQSEASLIPWITENFKSYFGIKNWLEENGINFSIERESWA
jgi:hypothetical protein